MDFCRSHLFNFSRLFAIFAVAILMMATSVQAQEAGPQKTKPAEAKTTSNPTILIDHLKILVKPLTKEELVIEADAWRDLLKAKITQIGQQRIRTAEKADIANKISEKLDTEDDGDPAPLEKAETKNKDAVESDKIELAASIPKLQQQQTELVNRFNVVIDALEEKGGEVEPYRQYISAGTGLSLVVGDTATALTIAKGWLTSEQGGQRWFWNIVKFVVILIAFYFAASIISSTVRHAASKINGVSQLLVSFLARLAKQAIFVIGVVVALAALEVNISPLLAAVGAAGFVVAFALQDTLSHLASGLLILAYRPFDVGHVVEAAGISGIVDSVSLFSTQIRTFDNKVMIVPNNDIWGGTITNASASSTRRVDLVFGIGYDDDIGAAKKILKDLVNDHPLVLATPAPVIRLHELADSSVNFVCRPWTKTGDYWSVYWDLLQSVKEEFDKNGISIPYPQRDVHVYNNEIASEE